MILGPLRSLGEIDQPSLSRETVHVLSKPRILWINNSAIETDFPTTWVGEYPCNSDAKSEIVRRLRRHFILQNAAIISSSQAQENEVNERIAITGETRSATRPPGYGRGLLVEAFPIHSQRAYSRLTSGKPIGLLDVKGVGLAPGLRPKIANHRTGVLPLPMAFEELANQILIDSIMKREGLDVAGVPIYALIDLGFRARIPGAGLLPCAALVRAAYQRPKGGIDLPRLGTEEQQVQIMLELVLRKYGFTSVTPMTQFSISRDISGRLNASYGNCPIPDMREEHIRTILDKLQLTLYPNKSITFGGINLQLARGATSKPLSARIIDFGHYNAVERFENPLLSLVCDRVLNWGGVLWPQDEHWVQPHDRCGLLDFFAPQKRDEELYRYYGLDETFTTNGMTIFALRLSRKVESGEISCAGIMRAMDRLVAKAIPRSVPANLSTAA